MYSARCINCGKLLGKSDTIYRVLTAENLGNPGRKPTCSRACALEALQRNLARLQELSKMVENQNFQIGAVSDFFPDS